MRPFLLFFYIYISIDHNALWDCCWLTLLTRARKFSSCRADAFDWVALAPILFTKARELLQLPTSDSGKSGAMHHVDFPHTFPPHYAGLLLLRTDPKKAALAKLAKILHFIVFQCTELVPAELMAVTAPAIVRESAVPVVGFNVLPPQPVKRLAVELVLFFQSVRSFLYPSNTGAWTLQLAFFMTTIVSQLSRHLGAAIGTKLMVSEGVEEARKRLWATVIDVPTLRYILGSLLPLLLEGLYGKNPLMSQCCSFCLKNLIAVDPNLGDVLIPFFLSALDESAVNQSHQGYQEL